MVRKLRNFGVGLLIFILSLTVLLSLWVIWLIRRPFPTYDGRVQIAGLSQPVTILRDQLGIPHIYAQNRHDLLLAQGYVHAQDRFWQMEFWRHIGQGRISEIVGEAGLDSDKFIRTVGWNRIGQETIDFYAASAPEYLGELEAYSAGVNAYLEETNNALSVNLSILQLVNDNWEIEPWTPLNSITWGVVMSHDLSGNYGDELRRARLVEALGAEQAADLFPDYPTDRPVIVPTAASTQRPILPAPITAILNSPLDWAAIEAAHQNQLPPHGFALGRDPFIGSNNWVVSGDLTDTGLPYLANDPHLSLQLPSIWYQIGLHAPGIDVVGFSFAGVPGVIIGHNQHIAWGVTNLGPDVQDLFIERLNPNDPTQYEFMGEWRDITTVEEVIHVNGGDDVVLQVRQTQHGPIVSDLWSDVDEVLALSWTAAQPSRVLQSVILLNSARDYDEFRAALEFWDVPGQNFVYADTEGNIAYQGTGLVPIRASGDGTLPVPGWTGEYEWTGFVPFAEMPARLNPPEGYIVTANNAVVDADFPHFIARDWADGNRAERITDLIGAEAAAGPITAADMTRIQHDNRDLLAVALVPLFVQLSTDNPQVQAAQAELAAWDYQLNQDSVAASIFIIAYWKLVPLTLADELGEESDYIGQGSSASIFMRQLTAEPESPWWDDVTTEAVETRDDQMLAALTAALEWLSQRLGPEMAGWEWGKLHQATFVSAPLGQSGIAPLETLVNRGPFPLNGGENTVNNAGWDWQTPALVDWHSSMRMVVDMANFNNSLWVIPTGQSGHPSHPHYADQITEWAYGGYFPMRNGEPAVRAAAVSTLTLVPAAK